MNTEPGFEITRYKKPAKNEMQKSEYDIWRKDTHNYKRMFEKGENRPDLEKE